MYTLVSVVALALGVFVTVSPTQAARVWGWKDLDHLGPVARSWYLRIYRAWGVILCLAGILRAAEK